MASSQTFTNTFVGGMISTIDPHEQPNSTYRYAIGGRLSYNRTDDPNQPLDENVKNGKTRAFSNAKGNSFSFTLCPGYQPIGSIETTKGAVVFSTNGSNSEIGFLTVNDNIYKEGYAKYITLYNDRSDPNADLLRFNIDNYIHGFSVYENEFIERVYWVDGYNQKRVLNLPLFYREDGTTWHTQGSCSSTSNYPKYLSAHAMDERMDLTFPKVKFWKRIPGRLKSGQYQVAVQYVSKTGHTSVWSTLTRPVWITTAKIDGSITIGETTYANAYKMNHHNRYMSVSNVMTEEGQAYTIEGIDTRWDQIRVCYSYSISPVAFQEANVFRTYDITSGTLVLELNSHTGVGLTLDELNQRFETVLTVGATAQQESRSWDADLETLPDLTVDLRNVKVDATFRYYRPDHTFDQEFAPVFNPVSGRNDNDPITNTAPTTKTIKTVNFTGDEETYNIVDDYESYKGQLFSQLFKGYFRGETYAWALVLIDRKGNPLFAQHITDQTFHNQFDTKDAAGNPIDYTLSRLNNDGQYDLRVMGAKFSNLRIPHSVMYDKFGKLNVSGFSIVRTKRIERIANQGVLINCYTTTNGKTDSDTDRWVQPHLFVSNQYMDIYWNGQVPNSHLYSGAVGSNYERKGNADATEGGLNASHYFNYYSPDILIEGKLPNNYLSGEMQMIGFGHAARIEKAPITGRRNHPYTKNYRSLPLNWPIYNNLLKYGRPKLGDKSRIKFATLHTLGKFGIYKGDTIPFDPETSDIYDFRANVWATLDWSGYFTDSSGEVNNYEDVNPDSPFSASLMPNAVIMKLSDFEAVDVIESLQLKSTYRTSNMVVTPENYYTADNTSSLDSRRYFSTGHYQPITQAVLNKVKKNLDDQGQILDYQFDDIEVFGGDCYNNLFDFTRLVSEFSDCTKFHGKYPSYSVSNIFPNESKYNIALLAGRRFAANAVYPQDVACENQDLQLSNGISADQPADWNYNEVLLLEENAQFFFPKPTDLKIVTKQPNVIRFSPRKTPGELEDSYRQKLPLDFGNSQGEFGRIQRLLPSFSYLYVLQERGLFSLLTQLDRAIATDTGSIQISSGSVFSGVRPVSKIYGTQHRNSAWVYNDNLGYVDARMGKIIVFSQAGVDPASDNDSISDPIAEKTIFFDKEISHQPGRFIDILSGLDIENNEVLTTFFFKGLENAATPNPYNREDELRTFSMIYSKETGNFHGESYNIAPFYFNIRRFLLTSNPVSDRGNEIFLSNHGLYGEYFRSFKPTILEFIVNPEPRARKTFDVIYFNVNHEGWERISKLKLRAGNNVHNITLAEITGGAVTHNDDRFEFDGSLLHGPSHELDPLMDKERLKHTYLVVTLTIDNAMQLTDGKNIQASLTNVDFKFRISSPNQF